ncbi:unnamed protein product [Acanthoscelides obtectus]|uniref:Uncharacterized protein n=1 Tax=Acanthoscelides obtectus TaxID=200917 RepID=A0A9P0LES6_ACAOB|nr:unnamed protein product [Acanthoscelides obtectus]CAK1680615.1 hypothetical protein AOBTE_LOCUS32806 [Acanthoscelides obtectus]
MLFGDDFAETCKSAKNLESLAKELKSTTATSSKNLKGHASRNRWRPTDNKKRPRNHASYGRTLPWVQQFYLANLLQEKHIGDFNRNYCWIL